MNVNIIYSNIKQSILICLNILMNFLRIFCTLWKHQFTFYSLVNMGRVGVLRDCNKVYKIQNYILLI